MTLGELIAALEAADPTLVVERGFNNPHSYRGYYEDLAFEPASNITVGEMLDAARSADGATYTGWKGGEFTMGSDTDVWLSLEGDASGDNIGAQMVELMLATARQTATPSAPADTDLRERAAAAIWALYADAEPSRSGLVLANPHAVADAVLAVLPAPADRAAVLVSRTAQACAEHVRHISESAAYALEVQAARVARGEPTALLRRMADEAQRAAPRG